MFLDNYENNITNIYIQKYESTINSDSEINENITVTGQLMNDNIKKVTSSFENTNAENYVFENEVILKDKDKNSKVENLKLLFVFDGNTYIPYTENITQLNKIKSYKVYSTGISITLEEGVDIENDYYTIRINRYDNNFKVRENKIDTYYYNFEPVVTKLTDWNNNNVLEFEFNSTYILKFLNNIEILLGYNEK